MGFKDFLNEKEGDKEAYQKFFDKMLKKYGVESPEELSDEDKKKFYDEVDRGWKSDDEELDEGYSESIGYKQAAEKIYSLSKSLRPGSALEKKISKDADNVSRQFKEMSKHIDAIIELWEDIEYVIGMNNQD